MSQPHSDVEVMTRVLYALGNFATGAKLSTYARPGTRTARAFVGRWASLAAMAAMGHVAYGRWEGRAPSQPVNTASMAGEFHDILLGLWVGAFVLLAVGGRKAMQWWYLRPHRRQWVEPAHLVLRGKCGWPAGTHADAYLHIPEDFSDAGMRIRMPKEFDGDEAIKAKVVAAARAKLPIGHMEAKWFTKGRQAHVEWVAPLRLPRRVPFSDPVVADAVAAAMRAGKPLLAMEAGSKPYVVDFTDQTPHLLFAAGTGAGKSAGVRAIAAQEMHNGAGVIVLDLKRRSQHWATHKVNGRRVPIPGVIYCKTVPHMHAVLCRLGQEIARRAEEAEELGDDEELKARRILVICEELNATMQMLEEYWREIRDSKAGDPTESPAKKAYKHGLLMGRAERVNMIAIAQMGTAKALGGSEAREQYGLRCLSRFSEPARKMLAPMTRIRSSLHRGRWMAVRGDDATEVQFMWMEDLEARDLAMSGVESKVELGRPDIQLPALADRPQDGAPLRVVRDPDEFVSVLQASCDMGRGVVQLTRSTLKQDRHRYVADGFPEPAYREGKTFFYSVDSLKAWEAQRAEVVARVSAAATAAEVVEAPA